MKIKIPGFTTEDELFKEIIKYNLWQALSFIGNVSIKVHKNPENYQDEIVNPWTLSRAAYYFVKYGRELGNKEMQYKDLVKIKEMIMNLYDPIVEEDNIWQSLNRLTREQFPYQYGYGEQIIRYYWIFTNHFLEEIKSEFEKTHNFDIYTYYQIFFYVLGNRKRIESSHFEYQSLLDYCLKMQSHYDFLKVSKIENFFCFISNDLENIKNEGKRLNKGLNSRYLKYEMSPLDVYPVINQFSGKRHFIIPSFESLQIKMSTGLYYYFQNLYNKGDRDNLFLTQVGYAFESYIEWLLKKYFGNQNVKKVSEELPINEQEHADWLVFVDDDIFIFECKARLLKLTGRQTYETKHIKPFLQDTIIKGCTQLANTKNELEHKYPKKEITKIFVTLDDFYFQKDTFNGLLKSLDVDKEKFNEVIMTTARGIEKLDSILETKTMKQICLSKESTEEYRKMDFLTFLHRITNNERLENKYLYEIFNDFIPKESDLREAQ